MTYPIEPIMNDMSQFNKQQNVVTQELDQAKTFIQAFSQRLRCFSQSSQIFESSISVQALYEQLMLQFHVFDYCSDEFGWMLLLRDNIDSSSHCGRSQKQDFALLGAIKECYKQIHDIGNDSFQDLLLSLKGALYLIQQYSDVIPQRHSVADTKSESTNECFTILSDSSAYISSAYSEDSSEQVINFLDLNPHLVQPVSYMPQPVSVQEDGSISLSEIRSFIVNSMFHVNHDQTVYMECPVLFTECPQGTDMAILYDSHRVESIQDLFEYPQKHYCFSVLAAEQILTMDANHPMTREEVDSMVIVKLDSFNQDAVKTANHDVLFYDKKISDLIESLSSKTDNLLELFEDMVTETLPLHQSLETLVSFMNGKGDPPNEQLVDYDSLKGRLHAMKQFHLALEHNQNGLFESIGYSDLLGDMIRNVGLLYEQVSESHSGHSNLLLSLHETGLDGMARDLHDVIIEASELFPEHKDVYGELYDLHMTVKKLIRQLEQRLSVYRRHLARLLQLSHPDHIEGRLIKECELMITRLTQRLAELSLDS
tara:strand:+ start:2593 stop:4212 length:1620 start_codon:yes stop_codon:yes gene_type:complete